MLSRTMGAPTRLCNNNWPSYRPQEALVIAGDEGGAAGAGPETTNGLKSHFYPNIID